MASITYTKAIPLADPADVVVVGGGPAGIAAAIAAARRGSRVVLLERNGYLGGNLTAGLVGPCMTSYSLDGQTQLIRGVFDEMVRRMEEVGGALHPSQTTAGDPYSGFIVYGHDKVTPFEPEAAKLIANRMCLEAGVEIRFHVVVVDAVVEDETVVGVVYADKEGLHQQPAAVVIDCSADGDVAAFAGNGFGYGRELDGQVQPMTMFFRVTGVNDAVVEQYVDNHPEEPRVYSEIIDRAREAGTFPVPRRMVGMYKSLQPGVWRINATRLHGLNGTVAADVTRGEIEGREQAVALLAFMREHFPGFENAELLDTASTVGIRETRRIDGLYELTLEDLQTGRHFDDVIALCAYPVDIHDPTGAGGGVAPSWATANEYEIPYRSLVPKDRKGLLVAGRCISASHEAMSAIRVMPPAFAMGEAAGAAAALAVRSGVDPRDLPVNELQRSLLEQGAYLGAAFETVDA